MARAAGREADWPDRTDNDEPDCRPIWLPYQLHRVLLTIDDMLERWRLRCRLFRILRQGEEVPEWVRRDYGWIALATRMESFIGWYRSQLGYIWLGLRLPFHHL